MSLFFSAYEYVRVDDQDRFAQDAALEALEAGGLTHHQAESFDVADWN